MRGTEALTQPARQLLFIMSSWAWWQWDIHPPWQPTQRPTRGKEVTKINSKW